MVLPGAHALASKYKYLALAAPAAKTSKYHPSPPPPPYPHRHVPTCHGIIIPRPCMMPWPGLCAQNPCAQFLCIIVACRNSSRLLCITHSCSPVPVHYVFLCENLLHNAGRAGRTCVRIFGAHASTATTTMTTLETPLLLPWQKLRVT